MLSDIGADAIKIGMLANKNIVEVVVNTLKAKAKKIPIIVDTVMLAKGGAKLLDKQGIEVLKEQLIPIAKIVTPNAPEAAEICNIKVESLDDMILAGRKIVTMGAQYALIKGGHIGGDIIKDVLVSKKNIQIFDHDRIETTSTHGTGCTLYAAIATGVAQNLSVTKAVTRGRDYVYNCIQEAIKIGKGHGPLNHII